jgi:uncharacterized protein (TIGR03032 family)
MPHSPRWHEGRLWLIDSGAGWLGWADLKAGRFERVAFLPGYGRGLQFIGRFAVVGLSKPRGNKTFAGLPLEGELQRRDVEPRCGLWIVDLNTGDAVHWLRIEGVVEELYDVAVVTSVRRPALIGLKADEIRRVIRIGPEIPV